MPGKTNHQVNKSPKDKQQYNTILKNSFGVSPKSTIDSNNVLLQGSNEVHSPYDDEGIQDSPKSVPTPKKVKLGHWIRDNIFSIIFVTIMFGAFAWLFPNLIEVKESIADLRARFTYLERDISKLDDSSVDKEVLEKELELINLRIEQVTVFSIDSLEKRMDSLEKTVLIILNEKKAKGEQ